MQITAHKNHIFLKEIEQQGNSRLILPPIFKRNMETVKKGVVKYCGPQSRVSVGETVIFDRWQDSGIEINGEKLLVIQSTHIIAVEV